MTLISFRSTTVRKSIARVLTVVNQKQRQNLREFYRKKKCEFRPQTLWSPQSVWRSCEDLGARELYGRDGTIR